MIHAGAGPNHCIISNGDPLGHKDVRGKPHAVAQDDRGCRGSEMRIEVIVPRGAQETFLGDHRVAADLDGRDGIEPDVVADRSMIADFNAPRVIQAGPGADLDPFADFASEKLEQPATEAIERNW